MPPVAAGHPAGEVFACNAEPSSGLPRATWERLAVGHSVFSSWPWTSATRRHVWPTAPLHLVTIDSGGDLAGLAPLVWRRFGPGHRFRELSFFNEPYADYNDFLTHTDPSVARHLIQVVLDQRGWDRIVLREIPEGPNLPALVAEVQDRGIPYSLTRFQQCLYIDLQGDWDSYARDHLSAHFRKRLRRTERHLAERGHVEFVRVSGPLEPRWLDTMARLNERRQSSRPGGWPLFARPGARGLIAELITTLGPAVDLGLLLLDTEPIAYVLGFSYDGIYSYWNIGHEPDFDEFSPGFLLLARLIEDSFGRFRRFDFLRGSEAYKTPWATGSTGTFRFTVYRSHALKAMHEIAQALWEHQPAARDWLHLLNRRSS
jgi:CelD/BcsL family acetyltransferase involved in cellulose biosynthesis